MQVATQQSQKMLFPGNYQNHFFLVYKAISIIFCSQHLPLLFKVASAKFWVNFTNAALSSGSEGKSQEWISWANWLAVRISFHTASSDWERLFWEVTWDARFFTYFTFSWVNVASLLTLFFGAALRKRLLFSVYSWRVYCSWLIEVW